MSAAPHELRILSPTFDLGKGEIDPIQRQNAGEFTDEALKGFLSELGNYFVPTAGGEEMVPAQCVDGRSRADGSYEPLPKAAAGTFSAAMGDALYRAARGEWSMQADEHAVQVYQKLQGKGFRIGGHDAEHHTEGGCGCGAEDNLERILTFMQNNADGIRLLLQRAGVAVPAVAHGNIVKGAGMLLRSNYVVPGEALRRAFVQVGGEQSVETLVGPHHEVALVINTEPGTTIDRVKLAEHYGDTFQAFELDMPSLQVAATALSASAEEIAERLAAMLYYNVATAAVLAGPSLRIATR